MPSGRASSTAIWSSESSQFSNWSSVHSSMRCFIVDLGMTAHPCCNAQRSNTCRVRNLSSRWEFCSLVHVCNREWTTVRLGKVQKHYAHTQCLIMYTPLYAGVHPKARRICMRICLRQTVRACCTSIDRVFSSKHKISPKYLQSTEMTSLQSNLPDTSGLHRSS